MTERDVKSLQTHYHSTSRLQFAVAPSRSIVQSTMLAMMSLALAASPLAIQNSKVLALRGGMSLGPINSGNFESSLKVRTRAPTFAST